MRRILTSFRFQDDWVELIMNLVSLALFSILVNGASGGLIKPSRGIRQGDPLSPFLFILMAKGFGRSISAMQDNNDIIELRVHWREDTQTHQQFVDDTMLMGYPSIQEARKIKDYLSNFGKASGLETKSKNSQVFFFHTPRISRRNICCRLGFHDISLPSKYMGIPLGNSIATNGSWLEILDSMNFFLTKWTLRPLNLVCRLVLVKSAL